MDITFDEHEAPRLTQMGLPNITFSQGRNPRPTTVQQLTIDNLRYILDGLGYSVKMNMMKGDVDLFDGDGRLLERDEFEFGMQDITNNCVLLGITNTNRLEGFMANIAAEVPYHPMLEWVESVPWDGEDRIEALCETVPVDAGAEYLRNLFIHKWLVQVMEGMAGWRTGKPAVSLPHVLVFAGAQGAGKTSWFRALGAATECELHLNSAQSKDHQLAVLKNPMAELSEIDSTFRKSDVSSLKSFISRSEDTIRAPFGRRAVTRRRMTVFCGSVNSADFLVDSTGSRRFWPIQVTGDLVLDHGIDMQQLWAQVKVLWDAGYAWTLSKEEDAARVADAEKFTAQYPEELALEAWMTNYGGLWASHEAKPVFEIMKVVGVSINPGSKDRVRVWLEKNLGDAKKIKGRANCWAWPMPPREVIDSKFVLDAVDAWDRYEGKLVARLIPETRASRPILTGDGKVKASNVRTLFGNGPVLEE